MGIFGHHLHIRHVSLSGLVHAIRDDVGAAERWAVGHTVVPAAHLVSGIGQALGGAERFAAHEVRALAQGVASTEHMIANGVEHGYRAIGHEVKSVGQVLGGVAHRIGSDVDGVWSFGEKLGHGLERASAFLPIVLAGGAIVWIARN